MDSLIPINLIMVLLGLAILINAGWIIDFAVWAEAYIYIPYFFWGIKLTKADALNIAYISAFWGTVIGYIGMWRLGYIRGRLQRRIA